MNSAELRQKYLDFFREKDHLVVPSFPLIPINDPSLLLINAGMAPLKPYFLDPKKAPKTRMASCQKCLRTKDIDEVGTTPRHLTLFEMLGNFSFGDYFKEEIIPWAWEFLIEWLHLPEERLFVSVFEKDDEAYNIWHKKVGLPKEKIFKLGEKDNFWFMADTGPCGPDSEIFYDLGEKIGCGRPTCQPGCDCSRYTEIWNLVFTQFDRQENGELKPLPKKNVDTGMGLERTVAALEGKVSVFEIDLFQPLIAYIHDKAQFKGRTETSGIIEFNPYFLMADHLRSSAFLISDDVYPGNEGRGYILRRIMRRAFLHAQKQGLKEGELIEGLKFVYDSLGDAYPQLTEKQDLIEKILSREEEGFLSTLSRGEALLDREIEKLQKKSQTVLSGKIAFELYDTYGFPLDLTRDILREKGFSVDEDAFNIELDKQRTRSRADTALKIGTSNAQSNKAQFGHPRTIFEGYDNSSIDAKLFDIWPWDPRHKENWSFDEPNAIILDSTPFYAEAGGQIGDTGFIEWDEFQFEVKKTIRDELGVILHLGKFISSVPTGWQTGAIVKATVTDSRRRAIMRAHTATHLMHAALRQVLGDHVKQAGSMVEDDRLRFDFSHYEAVLYDDLLEVTGIVNNWIIQSHNVDKEVMPYDKAIKTGAMALFGEKYEADVRVISIGDVSMELCGGTHLDNSSKIGSFVILREESIASGTRRIEALTGERAIHHFLEGEKVLKDLSSKFAVGSDLIESTVDRIFEEKKSLEKELSKVRAEIAKSMAPDIIAKAEKIGDTALMIHRSENMSADALMAMAETIRVKAGSHAALLIGTMPDKIGVVISVSDDLIKKGIKAGDLVREICKTLDGGGGGRPNLAQGGGKDASKIGDAQQQFSQIVKEKLR